MNLRAATTIVGAIAVSSILIALAFILSDSEGDATQTRTVTVLREAARPERGAQGSGSLGGPAQCGGEKLTVEGVSCDVGAEIRDEYLKGTRGELIVDDPEGGEAISVRCGEPTPVICKGPGGITVYFAP